MIWKEGKTKVSFRQWNGSYLWCASPKQQDWPSTCEKAEASGLDQWPQLFQIPQIHLASVGGLLYLQRKGEWYVETQVNHLWLDLWCNADQHGFLWAVSTNSICEPSPLKVEFRVVNKIQRGDGLISVKTNNREEIWVQTVLTKAGSWPKESCPPEKQSRQEGKLVHLKGIRNIKKLRHH